jgi:hypothetical protein
VAETSALGLDAGPTWVQEAPTGSVIQLSPPEFPEGPQAFRGRTPPPAGAGPSGQLGLAGYLLTSDIATDLANFGKTPIGQAVMSALSISVWLYIDFAAKLANASEPAPEPTPDAKWSFGHMSVEHDSLPGPSDVPGYRDALVNILREFSNSVAAAAELQRTTGADVLWYFTTAE